MVFKTLCIIEKIQNTIHNMDLETLCIIDFRLTASKYNALIGYQVNLYK